MATDFSLTTDFWEEFCTRYWDRQPTVIKQPFKRLFISESEILESLKSARTQLEYEKDTHLRLNFRLRFYLSRQLLSNQPAVWLPRQDESLESYARERQKLARDKDLTVVINYFENFNFLYWDRSRYFLKGLYEKVGLPVNEASLTLFLSQSPRTPFGIHKDRGSVFCFVVRGKKQIRAWPHKTFFNRVRPHVVSTYDDSPVPIEEEKRDLKDSILLTGEPGDIIYWPSSFWHVAENSRKDLSLSISMGLTHKANLHKIFLNLFSSNLPPEVRERALLASLSGNNFEKSEIMKVALDLKNEMRRTDFDRLVTEWWYGYSTGLAFKFPPSTVSSASLKDSDRVRISPGFPILLKKMGKEIILGASGRTLSFQKRKDVEALVLRLNKGEPLRVSQLNARKKGPRTMKFLKTLLTHRFIEKTS